MFGAKYLAQRKLFIQLEVSYSTSTRPSPLPLYIHNLYPLSCLGTTAIAMHREIPNRCVFVFGESAWGRSEVYLVAPLIQIVYTLVLFSVIFLGVFFWSLYMLLVIYSFHFRPAVSSCSLYNHLYIFSSAECTI